MNSTYMYVMCYKWQLLCAFRRERTTTTAFADDTDFLDLEDHLTPPSELYAGSGGKPPLSFHMDTKSHKKKSVMLHTAGGVT